EAPQRRRPDRQDPVGERPQGPGAPSSHRIDGRVVDPAGDRAGAARQALTRHTTRGSRREPRSRKRTVSGSGRLGALFLGLLGRGGLRRRGLGSGGLGSGGLLGRSLRRRLLGGRRLLGRRLGGGGLLGRSLGRRGLLLFGLLGLGLGYLALGPERLPPGGEHLFQLVAQLADLLAGLVEVDLGGELVDHLAVGNLADDLAAFLGPFLDQLLEAVGEVLGALTQRLAQGLEPGIHGLGGSHRGADRGVEDVFSAHHVSFSDEVSMRVRYISRSTCFWRGVSRSSASIASTTVGGLAPSSISPAREYRVSAEIDRARDNCFRI